MTTTCSQPTNPARMLSIRAISRYATLTGLIILLASPVSLLVGGILAESSTHLKMLEIIKKAERAPLEDIPAEEIGNVVSAKIEQAGNGDHLQLIPPFEGFEIPQDEQTLLERSYVIENKRFVEDLLERCKESTMPTQTNVMDFEPSFVLAQTERPDRRLPGTVPADVIRQAGFDSTKATTIHVHGFTQSYPATPYLRRIRRMAQQNLDTDRENLIFMDFGKSVTSGYAKSCAVSAVISSFLAVFVMKLLELGADRKSINLVGHSLGGQVIGLAAKKINPKIGRITAVDAAGPCFGRFHPNSNHSLAYGDAEQVVVFHYDDRLLGIPGQHGNIDIYVNGGSIQPGCGTNLESVAFQAALTAVLNLNRNYSLAHSRSALVASSNLGSMDTCQHVAYECSNYEAFKRGECGQCDENNSQCFFMGFLAQYKDLPELPVSQVSSERKKFYIATGDKEPYCSNHYQILVDLAGKPSESITAIHLELIDEKAELTKVEVSNKMNAQVFSHLVLVETPPKRFVRVRLQAFKKKVNVTAQLISSEPEGQPDSADRIAVDINFMSNIYPAKRKEMSTRLCSGSSGDLSSSWIELAAPCS